MKWNDWIDILQDHSVKYKIQNKNKNKKQNKKIHRPYNKKPNVL